MESIDKIKMPRWLTVGWEIILNHPERPSIITRVLLSNRGYLETPKKCCNEHQSPSNEIVAREMKAGSWKMERLKKMNSPPHPPKKECSSAYTSVISQRDLCQTSDLQHCRIINFCCVKATKCVIIYYSSHRNVCTPQLAVSRGGEASESRVLLLICFCLLHLINTWLLC